MRVLIVEDSAVARNNLAVALRERNIDVLTASNIQDGLAVLNDSTRCRLVLLDNDMSQNDALAFTEAVRKQPAFNGVAIVAMVVRADIPSATQLMQAGANEYVIKPVSFAALSPTLAKYGFRPVITQ